MTKVKAPTLASLRVDAQVPKEGNKPAAVTPEQPAAETPETPAETPSEQPSAENPAETPEQPAASAAANPTSSVEMVSISATELASLRAAQNQLNIIKPQFEILEKWHKNMKESGATGSQDASEATPNKTRVSKATQRAIDMKKSQQA